MKFEDAYYFKILIMNGFCDEYDEWLDEHLKTENPLSDIVLNLSLCGSDTNEIISCLHNYCAGQDFDESRACEKLRFFLKSAYNSNRFSKEETIYYMAHFADAHGDPGDADIQLWDNMFYMDYYYSLAKDGVLSWESFDAAFDSYINNGTPIDSEKIWQNQKTLPEQTKPKLKTVKYLLGILFVAILITVHIFLMYKVSTTAAAIFSICFLTLSAIQKAYYKKRIKTIPNKKIYNPKILSIVKKHIDEWDPIELLAIHCPQDEYDDISMELSKTITENTTIEALATEISDKFIFDFGRPSFDKSYEECKKIAYKIIDEIKAQA